MTDLHTARLLGGGFVPEQEGPNTMTAYSQTNPKFDAMLKRMGALHDAKNKGYAVAEDPLQNFRLCERFGIPMYLGIAVRLSDKMNRWMNIVGDAANDAVGEPVEETSEDIGVYILLFLMALEEWKGTHAVGDKPIADGTVEAPFPNAVNIPLSSLIRRGP